MILSLSRRKLLSLILHKANKCFLSENLDLLYRLGLRFAPRWISSDANRDERLSQYRFWQARYKKLPKASTFDWFINSMQLLESINNHLDDLYNINSCKQLRYLELGCGNSELPLSVYKESTIPLYVFAIDYVMNAVQQQISCAMSIHPKSRDSQFHAVCGDVLKLPFREGTFDIAVDKGTMDALLKNREDGYTNSGIMFSQVMRSLAPGGRYIQISDEDPDTRLEFLETVVQRNEQLEEKYVHITDENLFNLSEDHSVKYENIDENKTLKCQLQRQIDKSPAKYFPWKFKIVSDEQWSKEYFIYWTDKSKD